MIGNTQNPNLFRTAVESSMESLRSTPRDAVDRHSAPAPFRRLTLFPQRSLLWVLVLAAACAICGCSKEQTIIGRWTCGPTSFYFREDGVLFYKSSDGRKFSGPYYVDPGTSPMVIQSRLRALDGSRTRDLKLQIEFLTADRVRMKALEGGGNLTFKRRKEGEEGNPEKTIRAVPEVKRP